MRNLSLSIIKIISIVKDDLYENINQLFEDTIFSFTDSNHSDEFESIKGHFNRLKSEFTSLSNFEVKLIFPTILKEMEKLDSQNQFKKINFNDLGKLIQNKERTIENMVALLHKNILSLSLVPTHPLFRLISIFETSYKEIKKEWYEALDSWNRKIQSQMD